jgi:hypothetical protein
MNFYHVGFFLGNLAQLVVYREDKVFTLNQLHFTKCMNAEKLGNKVGLNMVVHNGPRKTQCILYGKCNNEREHLKDTYQLISFIALRNYAIKLRGP